MRNPPHHVSATVRTVLLAVCTLLAGALPGRTQAPAAAEPVTAFVGVTVLPMDTARALPRHTVVVRGDRIVQVGPQRSVRVPAGARVVQGRGRFLMPGLAEMHGHVPPPGAPAQYTEDVLFLYLASGITTVRGMLGAPGQLELRSRANRGGLLSPTLYLAGPSFNGNSVSSPEQAAEMVRRQKAEGWDLLKVHPGLTRAEYDAMASAAREAGIRFGGHVPEEVGLQRALEAGQETFDHMDGFVEYLGGDAPLNLDSVAAVVRRTREAGAWIVPTMALWEVLYGVAPLDSLRAFPELRYMPRNQVASWVRAHEQRLAAPEADREAGRRIIANRMTVLGALDRGGVRILMGTDAPQQFSVPGFSLHRELQRMSAAAMTPWQILRSGTKRVGEYFSGKDRFGLVAPGHRADLLLLDADPLRDVGNVSRIAGVMVRGRWIPRAEIDVGLEQIAARNQQ
jgi:imidazolonepropionase-like amidohydrolase